MRRATWLNALGWVLMIAGTYYFAWAIVGALTDGEPAAGWRSAGFWGLVIAAVGWVVRGEADHYR